MILNAVPRNLAIITVSLKRNQWVSFLLKVIWKSRQYGYGFRGGKFSPYLSSVYEASWSLRSRILCHSLLLSSFFLPNIYIKFLKLYYSWITWEVLNWYITTIISRLYLEYSHGWIFHMIWHFTFLALKSAFSKNCPNDTYIALKT